MDLAHHEIFRAKVGKGGISLHARTCLCASPNPIYQRKSFTTTSLRLAYKKVWACVLVFVCALVFLLLSGVQG